MEATKSGTTTLGLVYKDGVVLAADRQASAGSIALHKNVEKVLPISENVGITTAGMVGDLQAVVRIMRSEMSLHKIRSGSRMSAEAAVGLLSTILFNRRLSLNLLYAHFLIGGFDSKPVLYSLDEAGGAISDKYTVTGSGGVFALGVLQNDFHENMTETEAVKLAKKAISAALERDIYTGGGVDIAVINKGGYKKLSDEEIQKMISK